MLAEPESGLSRAGAPRDGADSEDPPRNGRLTRSSGPRLPGLIARLSRGQRIALAVGALIVFLAISALLARFLSVENLERDDILAVLNSEAAGSAEGMLARLNGCRQAVRCAATVRADAQRLRRPGSVKILSLTSSTAYSFTGVTGNTRVAWTVIGRLPVVQCVRVRRAGNFLSGVHVTLLSLTPPIAGEADC